MYIHIKLIPLPQSTSIGEHYFFKLLKTFHIFVTKMKSLFIFDFFFFEDEQFLL